jgi:hypothetical protein
MALGEARHHLENRGFAGAENGIDHRKAFFLFS